MMERDELVKVVKDALAAHGFRVSIAIAKCTPGECTHCGKKGARYNIINTKKMLCTRCAADEATRVGHH